MKSILVIQHVEYEGLGIIEEILQKRGFEFELIISTKNNIPKSARNYSAIIIMGGPMGVYEQSLYPFISDEIRLIKNCFDENIPVLGVCLGAQLVASAAGAKVYKGNQKEIGWYNLKLTEEGKSDFLFRGLPEEFPVFQWHGDTFDIPDNCTNLASSDLFPNQIIKVGENVYGLQFHLEVTEEMIKNWIMINDEELKSVKSYINIEDLSKHTRTYIDRLNQYGQIVFNRFFDQIQSHLFY